MTPGPLTSSLSDVELTLVETMEEVEAFMRWLGERRPIMGVDLETTGLSLAKDRTRLIQFGDAQHGWALPYADWRGVARDVLTRYEGPMVLQHAKFDAGFLQKDGLPFPWAQVHDTMFMAFLHDSQGPKSLKAAAALHVDPAARAGEVSLKKAMAKNRWGYDTVPLTFPLYWGYAAMDVVLTARLAEVLWPMVQPYRGAYDLELACERVLCDMELRGVAIDPQYCARTREELLTRLEQARGRLGDVNPSAPAQVVEALQRIGAHLTKRTEHGNLSVDDEVLSSIDHPIARDVLEARSLNKIITSYFDNFLAFNDDGILHPHINQLAARTGRMSVTEPALQTIPRTSLVRDAFIPREGNSLVLCDYDNEELRVAAHFSGDENMLQAFAEGRDLHGESAKAIFGSSYTREQRGIGKAAMFAKAYGAGINKFALATGLPMGEASRVFKALDAVYPGITRIMQQITLAVRDRADGGEFGWIALSDGRHLKVPAAKPYTGFNYLVQGSCAVVLKQSLVDLDLAGLGDYLVLPVHDEIVFDVPTTELVDVVPAIQGLMTREEWRAPLTASAKTVERWGDPYREQ